MRHNIPNLTVKVAVVIVISCLVQALASCTSAKLSGSSQITVQLLEPNRMRFSGKGAGAGMMLMSSMGPMGIAIGVAIDEGIGKDIEAQLNNSGSGFQPLLTDALLNRWPSASVIYLETPGDSVKAPFIQIAEYGFKMTGKDELAVPYLEGSIQCDQTSDSTPIATPEQLEAYAALLEKLKHDGLQVKRSLQGYLIDSFKDACN